jgi:non-specific serine/threonine protein kinase/serine/threonine-protein kinase
VTGEGVPKVLDFGVAKLLEGSGHADATMTRALAGPLTPNYASPEQLRGLPITTASDVYALGVLTYEVVSGRRPYETSGKTLDEVLELVLKTEPPRPSAAASASSSAGHADSYRRLKGDLDAIVLKAMSKEPEHRYGSAGELADDLERFLAGKPVVAREPSIGYVMRRLAGRNKAAVAILAASLIAILSALGIALWQRQVAIGAQARAEQRFKDVRQLANALIFKIHDAVMGLPGSTPVRQTIVNEALSYLERLEAESKGDESLQIELSGAYRQIGSILGDPGRPNLGDRDAAIAQYEKARKLVLPLVQRDQPSFQAMAALVNTNVLLSAVLNRNRDERGRVLADEAVKYAQRLTEIPNPHPEAGLLLGRAMFNLSGVLPDEESVAVWQRTVEIYEAEARRRPNDTSMRRNVALAEKYLGGTFDTLGRLSEAETHYRRALDIDEKNHALAPDNRTARFDLAIDLANVASILEAQDRIGEAYTMFSRSLEMRRLLSESDPTDQLSKGRLGFVLTRAARLELELGNKALAVAHAREAVEITQSVLNVTKDPSSRIDSGKAIAVWGDVEWATDDRVNACDAYRRAARIFADREAARSELFYAKIVERGLEKCGKAGLLK